MKPLDNLQKAIAKTASQKQWTAVLNRLLSISISHEDEKLALKAIDILRWFLKDLRIMSEKMPDEEDNNTVDLSKLDPATLKSLLGDK